MNYIEEDQLIVWLCSLKEMDLTDLTYVLHSIINGDESDVQNGVNDKEKKEKNGVLLKLAIKVIKSAQMCVGVLGMVERMILHVILEKEEYSAVLVEMLKTKGMDVELTQKEQRRVSEHILPVLLKIITTDDSNKNENMNKNDNDNDNDNEKGEKVVDDNRVKLFHMLTGWLVGDWQALKQTVFQWLDWNGESMRMVMIIMMMMMMMMMKECNWRKNE